MSSPGSDPTMANTCNGLQSVVDEPSPSFGDMILSALVGSLWTVSTKTIDPWTKQVQVDTQAADYYHAGMCSAQAEQQACLDVTRVYLMCCVDPSQAKTPFSADLPKLKLMIEVAITLVALYLAFAAYEDFKLVQEAAA